MRIIELLENIEYFEENAITNDDLREVYDGMIFMASKGRSASLGAALVYALQGEDKISYFNKTIIPMWEKHFQYREKNHIVNFKMKLRSCG
jgi:hypothetical protein